ncbi:MAG: hypothetical protein M3279_07425 [Actinomycetota bacterium]|nr:hypothetical protein [Actinomycetota bacterium]
MNDVEMVLSATLAERADAVLPRPGHRDATLRRMRRRRVRNAVSAGVVALALVAGGVVSVGALVAPPAVRPAQHQSVGTSASTAGPYGFWSTSAAEYPYVAKGSFRGARWRLRAAAVRLAAGADVRLTIQVERTRRRFTSSAYVRDYGDPLFTRYEHGSYMFGAKVAIVFGAAAPDAQTVDVSLDDGNSVSAHVFTDYDPRTTLEADYYLAFLPADATGEVVARDGDGNVIATEVIPPR